MTHPTEAGREGPARKRALEVAEKVADEYGRQTDNPLDLHVLVEALSKAGLLHMDHIVVHRGDSETNRKMVEAVKEYERAEAGERESTAQYLKAAAAKARIIADGRIAMFPWTEVADMMDRAANLLRTEPGGEPVAWTSESELARLKEHGSAVVQNRKCRHWQYGKVNVPLYLRPTTPVEPEER